MPLGKTSLVMPCYIPTEEHVGMTITALQTLNDFGRPDEVIVVDDGSPVVADDKILPLVDRIAHRVKNEGFPKTVNHGWSLATGDVIITANNDLTFNPGWLEGILYPLEHGYDISSILVSDQNNWELEDEIEEGAKFGSLWAMSRKVYQALGGFDERFGRGYFEDLDYRRRALNQGFKIGKYHGAIVEHLGRATYSVLDPTNQLYEQNKQVYIDKWSYLE